MIISQIRSEVLLKIGVLVPLLSLSLYMSVSLKLPHLHRSSMLHTLNRDDLSLALADPLQFRHYQTSERALISLNVAA